MFFLSFRLVRLYALCIDLNLVPNVLDEIYLMFELLTLHERSFKSTSKSAAMMYLNNVHNCVYFACEVLLQEYTENNPIHLEKKTTKNNFINTALLLCSELIGGISSLHY